MKKKSLMILFFVIIFFVNNANAEPTVDNILTEPESPKPLSTFKLIATITGENIQSVDVVVSECTDGPPEQCFVPHLDIPTMTLNAEGKYETEVKLTGTQDTIDHVQYQFTINDNGTDYTISDLKTYLDLEANNGKNNGGNNNTPSFEFIMIILSIALLILIFKKRETK